MSWGPFDLTGKGAIVTGAAMGIGFGIAARLREAGAHVLVADIDEAAAADAVKRLKAGPGSGKIESVRVDVSDTGAARATVDKAVAAFGAADVLVNNAGIYPIAPLASVEPGMIDRILKVNVHGVILMAQAFANQNTKQGGGGSIVNIASMDAFHPSFPGLATYGASKGAVVALTKHLALELGPQKIRVNAIAPGAIMTEGAGKTSDGGGLSEPERLAIQDAVVAKIVVGRMGEPDDIARVAVFLASPAAAYVTGQTLITDGGFLLS